MQVPEEPHLVDSEGRAISLATPVTMFGRAPESHVVIADRRASRRHAEISVQADAALPGAVDAGGALAVLRDLGSTNGTWLNGRRLTEPERLRDGDVLAIAGTSFTYRDPDATLVTTQFPRIVVDEGTGELWVDRCPVHLSGKQRALFMLLWRRRGRACTKDDIASSVWPECSGEVFDYQIESLVKRLRAKLELQPGAPTLILNEPGLGYRLTG